MRCPPAVQRGGENHGPRRTVRAAATCKAGAVVNWSCEHAAMSVLSSDAVQAPCCLLISRRRYRFGQSSLQRILIVRGNGDDDGV